MDDGKNDGKNEGIAATGDSRDWFNLACPRVVTAEEREILIDALIEATTGTSLEGENFRIISPLDADIEIPGTGT